MDGQRINMTIDCTKSVYISIQYVDHYRWENSIRNVWRRYAGYLNTTTSCVNLKFKYLHTYSRALEEVKLNYLCYTKIPI